MLSVVVLGVHYGPDSVGGVLFCLIAAVVLFGLLFRWLAVSRRRR